jgi:Transcriptional regulators containing a DNA-binding HTH domain and an aminotransferase domain (MocR family) and their eukaryotic orthologs
MGERPLHRRRPAVHRADPHLAAAAPGVFVAPEEILLTVGAQHAIYLLATLLVDERTVVGIEDPGYADARNIFALRTSRLVGLAVDQQGLMDSEALETCNYVHVTPSHQFPTTVTMSLARRRALIERAAREDIVFIEDDYEAEINHQGGPTPALKSLDQSGRVIFVGSLSKTIAPGLRMGYLVGPRELIAEARALRRLMLRHPPANNQRTAALFLARGHYDSLLRREGQSLKQRWAALQDALSRHMTHCRFQRTTGGHRLLDRGPAGAGCKGAGEGGRRRRRADRARRRAFPRRGRPRNFFRLGFSSIPAERIEPGIKLLAEVIAEQARWRIGKRTAGPTAAQTRRVEQIPSPRRASPPSRSPPLGREGNENPSVPKRQTTEEAHDPHDLERGLRRDPRRP